MFTAIFLFVFGFFLLIKSSNYLIDGSSSVAKYFTISPWVIGMVIVGIGTSVPELAIMIASLNDGGMIGLGTVIGSNSFNILFILGLSAMFFPLVMKRTWVHKDFFYNIFAVILTALFLFFPVLGDKEFFGLSRLEGLVLLSVFTFWIWDLATRRRDGSGETSDYKVFTLSISFIMILGGLVGVFLGGKWVVDGGVEIATALGASKALIGLTLVGIGTSIPELTVTLAAALRKRSSLAVGSIIGSNIFDFLGVLGFASLIKQVPFDTRFTLDLSVTLMASVLLLATMYIGRKYIMSRKQGLIFVILYLLYFVVILIRG
ncbi:MAG: calcium/sodium antiporter [bacterium]|nr:calcium/sodium antiporter [bacterium]